MINKLVEYLKQCDDAYYNTDQVLISNDTYDAMVETLRKLDPENEYLSKVGAKVRTGTNKLGRINPMGTLSKYHKDEEVKDWVMSERCFIMVSPKYDGFGVELTYVDGKLVFASTRGDGNVGEDVTEAIYKVDTVPKTLPDELKELTCVRGECIIPRRNHEEIKTLGYTAMRNAVPGIVRSCREDALKYVDFVAYEFFDGNDDRVSQRLKYNNLFITEDFTACISNDFDTILKVRNEFGEVKDSYDYEIDGVVLKTVEIKEDDYSHPKHQIAWKWKSNRENTVLREVEFQMGVSGYFTPIGIFDEVEFQGAKLKRASLGNMTRLHNEFEGLTIGSLIDVSRRGDIIPYIEELTFIDTEGTLVGPLTECPHCGSILEYDEYEPHCVNKSCPEKLRLQISQFARSIGVKGIGDKLIRGLIDGGYLKSVIDVYAMEPDVILNLPRQGKSSVEKWEQLQNKELSTLEIFSCYPFLDLGERVWKLVLSRFTAEEVLDLDYDTLSSANIKGLGDKKILSIVSQISENREEISYLLELHRR